MHVWQSPLSASCTVCTVVSLKVTGGLLFAKLYLVPVSYGKRKTEWRYHRLQLQLHMRLPFLLPSNGECVCQTNLDAMALTGRTCPSTSHPKLPVVLCQLVLDS